MREPVPAQPYKAALIIPVPETEPLVGEFRLRFDPTAALGMPAHITINYPFKPHLSRPAEARVELFAMLSRFSQFAFSLSEIRTFAGGVIYLAPTPAEPFVTLIDAVASLFPDSPPYEGRFDRTPHLTVAQVEKTALGPLQAEFSENARRFLPLHSQAKEVRLIDNSEIRWNTRQVFPLAPVEDRLSGQGNK